VKCVAISKQWVTAVEDCEYTVTLLRMTLRIGHRGFQPALVTIVTLLYFRMYVMQVDCGTVFVVGNTIVIYGLFESLSRLVSGDQHSLQYDVTID